MSLSSADLAVLGGTPITIRSTYFANVYLRMDGTGVTAATGSGGGTVNCQYGAGDKEKYRVRPQADGSCSFESVAFPKVWLRMDGTGVTTTGPGGGTVNCQYAADAPGPCEKYWARAQGNGSFSFESAAFPNVFLRLVGSGVTATTAAGGGIVNCQFNANGGGHETFFLDMADQGIDFAMQHQEQTWWCWNAATVSVAKFYNPAAAWTQGSLANAEFARNDCTVAAGQVSPCNWGRWPDAPLQRVGHFGERLNNALTSVQLGAELAKSAPVVVNIAWRDRNGNITGGHIVALRGRSLRDGVEWVSVSDPWSGDSDMTYESFRNSYPDNGLWNVSYRTRSQG
ncbi:papain-like cysteine protease family protein [Saccharothrix syringae]|uniref:papain-like cysteine protease family protein n=1 Tax=Saccharothrix syringae TaxID=103733 RepID=UPI000A071B42|nr:papain-like cysteine protease family protein [Saccharothrix syringae]